MNFKIILRILVNTLIGIVLIFIWLKLVNVSQIWQELKKVNPFYLFIPILLFAIASFLRSVRLGILLSKYEGTSSSNKIPALNLFFLNTLSQFLSFLIPIRAGEVAKGIYLSTEYRIPFSKALIWVLLDRFLDFWFTLVLALILILFIPTNLPSNFKPALVLMIILFTLATALLLFAPKLTKSLAKFVSKLLIFNALKKFVINLTDNLIENVHLLKKGTQKTLNLSVLTIFGLILDSSGWIVIFSSIPNAQVPLIKSFLGSLLTSLTYLIPAAPGYVGSAEASGLAVFSYGLGLDQTVASVASLLYHTLTLIYILLFGLIGLYVLKFNLKLVIDKFKKIK